MYSEKQIFDLVSKKLNSQYSSVTIEGVRHISNMLIEIQLYLIDNKSVCKFAELCSNENWVYAKGIADGTNKQILTETTIFQDFVKVIGRERKINKILKEDE